MMPGGSCDGAGSAQAASTSATTGAVTSTSASKRGGGTGTSSSAAMKKGPWTAPEDAILMEYVRKHGEGNWNAVQKNSGLSRCGKSCRLRWANHLRPNLKKGPFSPDEERLILELHAKFGNKWARMASQLPGRTDNEIKNYWNTRIKRRQRAVLPLYPPDIQHQAATLHHRPSTTGLAASPLSDHKALYSTSIGTIPLSLFDPINFAAPGPGPGAAATTTTSPFLGLGYYAPFLAPSSPRAKRFRADDAGGFSLPFRAPNPVAPPPSSQNPFFPFNCLGAFDLSPPTPPPQQHQHHQQQQQHGFTVKMELPSSQFSLEPSGAITTGCVPPLRRSNCELLDALLRDTHPMCGGSDGEGGDDAGHEPGDGLPPAEATPANVRWAKGEDAGGVGELPQGLILGAAGGKWDDSDHAPTRAHETKGAEGAGAVEDDLSALLDLIPMAAAPAVAAAAAAPREWYNSNSGEVSNGRSSGVTDENVGLQEMQQLAPSLSMAAEEDHSWSIGCCHWNDMPSTC